MRTLSLGPIRATRALYIRPKPKPHLTSPWIRMRNSGAASRSGPSWRGESGFTVQGVPADFGRDSPVSGRAQNPENSFELAGNIRCGTRGRRAAVIGVRAGHIRGEVKTESVAVLVQGSKPSRNRTEAPRGREELDRPHCRTDLQITSVRVRTDQFELRSKPG
jgi:hypothetical protein